MFFSFYKPLIITSELSKAKSLLFFTVKEYLSDVNSLKYFSILNLIFSIPFVNSNKTSLFFSSYLTISNHEALLFNLLFILSLSIKAIYEDVTTLILGSLFTPPKVYNCSR